MSVKKSRKPKRQYIPKSQLLRTTALRDILHSPMVLSLFVCAIILASVLVKFAFAGNERPVGSVTGIGSIIFQDEFNGTSLDLSKWQPNWHMGSDSAASPGIEDSELNCYDPKNVTVGPSNTAGAGTGASTLKLSAEKITPHSGCVVKSPAGQLASYASGMIHSKSLTFTQGYYEARVYFPGDSSKAYNFGAFWTTGSNWPTTGEIDVAEVLGGGGLCWNYHDPTDKQTKACPTLADHSGWHILGLKREIGKLTYYYDGIQVGVATTNIVNSPHEIIADYAISLQHGGALTTPATMEVDYIRVWNLNAASPSISTTPTVSVTPSPTPTNTPMLTPSPTVKPSITVIPTVSVPTVPEPSNTITPSPCYKTGCPPGTKN